MWGDKSLSNRSTGAYLSFVGFIILLLGIFVVWSSTGMAQGDSFASNSALSNSAIELLLGSFVALVGTVLLLIGLLSAMRKSRYSYY
jgi:uncharacterized membrane protein